MRVGPRENRDLIRPIIPLEGRKLYPVQSLFSGSVTEEDYCPVCWARRLPCSKRPEAGRANGGILVHSSTL